MTKIYDRLFLIDCKSLSGALGFFISLTCALIAVLVWAALALGSDNVTLVGALVVTALVPTFYGYGVLADREFGDQ